MVTCKSLHFSSLDDEDYTIDCSEEEFHELTERLLENDENNCTKYFRYDFQRRREGCEDVCDDPLFYDVQPELWEVPTVKKLIALYDNYERVKYLFIVLFQ